MNRFFLGLTIVGYAGLASAQPTPMPVPAPVPVAPAQVAAPAQAPAPALEDRVRVSASETSAFGLTHVHFFNQLAGVRADYRFTDRFAFGGGLSYANLRGKDGRANNLLPELALDYRLPLNASVGVPWRFAGGFLPKNGPTLRWSVGLYLELSKVLSLELDPLEPMIWVTKNRPEVSADVSASLSLAF